LIHRKIVSRYHSVAFVIMEDVEVCHQNDASRPFDDRHHLWAHTCKRLTFIRNTVLSLIHFVTVIIQIKFNFHFQIYIDVCLMCPASFLW
jgi:hypothetical protein